MHTDTDTTLRPRRRLSQNFLVDPRVANRIVDALSLDSGEPVLEIGPGRGALTAELIRRCGRIAAVELDRRLAAELRHRFAADELLLYERDALRLRLGEVAETLAPATPAPLAVVGNLPYHISKPLALMLVEQRRHVARAVLMYQREVADRLTAEPGSRDYGPLGILVGLAYRVAPLFDVKPGAFHPRPAVVSTVTGWTPRAAQAVLQTREPVLRRCLRASFAHRRRTLLNNVRAALGDDLAPRVLEAAELDGSLRPAVIPPAGYVRLARHWPEAG